MKKPSLLLTILWIYILGSCFVISAQGQGYKFRRPEPIPHQPRRVVRQYNPLRALFQQPKRNTRQENAPIRVSNLKPPLPPAEGLIPVKKIGNKFYTYEPLFGPGSQPKQNGVLYPVPEHILKQFSVLKQTKGVMEEVQAASENVSSGYVESPKKQQQSSGGYSQSQPAQNAQPKPSGGYSYKKPEQQSQAAAVPAPPTGGYVYKRPPPLAETTTELPEVEETEPVIPARPQIDFETTERTPAIGLETEQDNLADAVTVPPKVTPVTDTPEFELNKEECHDDGSDPNAWPCGYKGVISGTAGVDYPVYSSIPKTGFDCRKYQYSGYYADIDAQCQSFHVCLRRAQFRRVEKWSFLCPNGTVFSQEDFACVWWDMAPACDQETRSLYEKNANLGWDEEEQDGSIKSYMTSMVRSQLKGQPTTIGNRREPKPTLPTNAVRAGFPKPKSSPAKTKTRTESQSQARSKSRTQSAILKSESEAYEEKSAPNALEEEPEGFIVNRQKSVGASSTEQVPGEILDYDLPEQEETPRVPTVVMMPIAQQSPDGTETVSNVPVMVMMTTPRPPAKATFAPIGVNNPFGVTIPNKPARVHGGYASPKKPSKAYGVPGFGLPAPAPPTTPAPTYIPPRQPPVAEQEEDVGADYQTPEEQIPASRPVIDYELPVQEESEPPPQNKYLPPKPQGRTATSSGQAKRNGQTSPAPKKTRPPAPSTGKPATPSQKRPAKQLPKPLLAGTNKEAFSQILESSGVSDMDDGDQEFTEFSRTRPPTASKATQPKLKVTPQAFSETLGTKSQLYNANVRDLYTKKERSKGQQPSDKEENREDESFETAASIILKPNQKNIQSVEEIKPKTRDLPENTTNFDEDELRAFLTSQEDLDPSKIIEVHHFDKYALFVPENGKEKTAEASEQPAEVYGAPTKEFQSSSSGSKAPTKKASPAQKSTGGYASSQSSSSSGQKQEPASVEKPQEEYGTPNKEFNANSGEGQIQPLAKLPESFAQIYAPIQSETYVPMIQPFNQPGAPIILQAVRADSQQLFVPQSGYSQPVLNQQANQQSSSLPQLVQQILSIQPPDQKNQPQLLQMQFPQPFMQFQIQAGQQPSQQYGAITQQLNAPSAQQYAPTVQQQLQLIQQQLPKQNFLQVDQSLPADPMPDFFKSQEIKLTPPALQREPLFSTMTKDQQQQLLQSMLAPQKPKSPAFGQTGFFSLPQDQFPELNQIPYGLLSAEQLHDQIVHSGSSSQEKRVIQPFAPGFDLFGSSFLKPEIVPSLSIHESTSTAQIRQMLSTLNSQGYNANKNPAPYQIQSSGSSQSHVFTPSPSPQRPQQTFGRSHYNKNSAERSLLPSASVLSPVQVRRPVQMEKFTFEDAVRSSRINSNHRVNQNIAIQSNRPKVPVHNSQSQHEQVANIQY